MQKLLAPREAANILGISYPTLKQWIYHGKIKSMKTPGGHHRVPESEIDRLFPKKLERGSVETRRGNLRKISGRNQLIGRVLEVKYSGLLAHGTSRDDLFGFSELIAGVLEELKLHKSYTEKLGVSVDGVTPLPATKAYVDFLLGNARQGDLGETIAGMTPCPAADRITPCLPPPTNRSCCAATRALSPS